MAMIAALILPLSACAVAGDRQQQMVAAAQIVAPADWHDGDAVTGDVGDVAAWWGQFNDPVLTALIEKSLRANNDLAAATGRLRSARAALSGANGAFLPTLNAGGGASRSGTISDPQIAANNFAVSMDAAWEIDLFGKLRGASAAATADVASSQASLFDVQRVIAADVAFQYLSLRDAQARLAITNGNLTIQRENSQIAAWRNQAGLVSALDVEQAKTALAQTEASLPLLRQSIGTAINQIDVLSGAAPGVSGQMLEVVQPVPAAPAMVGDGLPAELLTRRPDVMAAQKNLEAAAIRIGVVRADLYPALRLSGSISSSAALTSNLFSTVLGNVAGNLAAPIFDAGKIRARLEQQKGATDVALANYRKAILIALQDVENAMVAVRTARMREAALGRAEAAAQESLRLAEFRYRSGDIAFLTLLDSQRSLLSAQDSHQSAKTAQSNAAVQMFKALGGGWTAAMKDNSK